MNGRQLVGDTPGAWFRRDHPGLPFPLWLVRLLRFSGEEDPGHEEEWKQPDDKIRSGEIPVDLATRGFVGFLLDGKPQWKGETLSLAKERERTRCMVAGPLFRHRYAGSWPMPVEEEDDDED